MAKKRVNSFSVNPYLILHYNIMLINIRESKLGSFDMSFYHENMGVSVFQKLSVSDRKGLISRVAQYISPGTLLVLINWLPESTEKKLYPTKPGSTPRLLD